MRYGRKCGSNWGCYCFLFEKKTNILSNITYSPSHRQASTPMINIQSTLRTAPDVCKNVSLAVIIQIIHIQSVRSLICAYIYIHTYIYTCLVWLVYWLYLFLVGAFLYDWFVLLLLWFVCPIIWSFLPCLWYIYIYIYIYIYARVCVYIYTYIHTHIHTHIHAHIHAYIHVLHDIETLVGQNK